MAVASSGFVTLDCSDPEELGRFWASMLGGEVVFARGGTVGVRTPWTWIACVRIDDHRPPTWPDGAVPKQVHLDLDVDDLDAAVAEAESCGAVPAPFQPAPEARRIMLDPAGHPFCLTTQIPREAR